MNKHIDFLNYDNYNNKRSINLQINEISFSGTKDSSALFPIVEKALL